MTLCEERVGWQRAGVGVGVGELAARGEEHERPNQGYGHGKGGERRVWDMGRLRAHWYPEV